ncbi:hypothetical protein RND81_13G209200 [Saponaria officinalis]|uniref:Uncharacterized protein n=1 Tax=Saponaria officinalis TaxID=3572 RepID=A0AAW1H2E5_SAPOF
MGNCANKPATTEGEVPVAEEKVAETTEREIVLETKDEEKKPEVEAAKPAEPSTAAVEPVKAESSETKPAEVVAAPAKVEAPAPEKKAEEKK